MLDFNTLNSVNACHSDSFHRSERSFGSLKFDSNSSDHLTVLLSLYPVTLVILPHQKVKKRTDFKEMPSSFSVELHLKCPASY